MDITFTPVFRESKHRTQLLEVLEDVIHDERHDGNDDEADAYEAVRDRFITTGEISTTSEEILGFASWARHILSHNELASILEEAVPVEERERLNYIGAEVH